MKSWKTSGISPTAAIWQPTKRNTEQDKPEKRSPPGWTVTDLFSTSLDRTAQAKPTSPEIPQATFEVSPTDAAKKP